VISPDAVLFARRLHEAGRLQEAEAAYRQVIQAQPQNIEALNLLGALLYQLGRFGAAVEVMEVAVRRRPTDAVLRNNLGNALKDAGRPAEAEASYRKALELRADFADAHSNLGALLHALRRFDEAESALRTALKIQGRHAYAHNSLGMVMGDLGRIDEALHAFRSALAIRPDFAQAHYNLGVALLEAKQPEAAEPALRRALALAPQITAIRIDLGNVLTALGRFTEAEQTHREALRMQPASTLAHLGLAAALRQRGELTDAETHCRHALQLDSGLVQAHKTLGLTLFQLGKVGEAEQAYRRALALEPLDHVAFSSLLFLSNHQPHKSPVAIYEEHREFGRRFGAQKPLPPHRHNPDPDRPLRIGYVSADLRAHSVAFFFEPVLAKHDESQFEITCYHSYGQSDATTQRIKSLAHTWRDVWQFTDDQLAKLIREDGIDILVDLGGHTAHNRLLTFARKPAPVQAAWLGYLNTTGLDAMDWRITDAQACPAGMLERLHTETLLRLPHSQWCYQPPDPCPDVAPAPIVDTGICTFAAFSAPAKINERCIELWSAILREAPKSRLLVVPSGLMSPPADYREHFARAGIPEDRLEIIPSKPFGDYLALHGRADVMLDTFPYTGGTTTCHTLWMGVPVITLVGDTATSRGGASLLSAVGLPDLVAQTPEQYVAIAVNLAANPERLQSLRRTLRERMRSSVLTDAARFTSNLERAYRMMWQQWCTSASR
jgi:protein O-GlcNAc transferase